jgi:putative ABC transport system permease protein
VNGFLVLPRAALGRRAPAASALLAVGGGLDDGGPDGSGLDDRALTAAVARWHAAGTVVTLRSQLLAALEQAPLERGAYLELALGGIAAAAGALLALLLVLLLSAQSRQLTLARAATMGMSTVQARLLVLIEALPQILAVIVGGLICALALAPLVGPALGLSVFTGSATPVPVRIEPAWLTGAALALLILAIATLSGQAVLAGRGTARSLRIGG